MKISFAEAANSLENICNEIDNLADIDEAIQLVFKETVDELAHAVDRRISYLEYADSQIYIAKKMRDSWVERIRKFETITQRIKSSTIETMKLNPNLPYKGELGSFRVQKNTQPSLIIRKEEALWMNPDWHKLESVLDKAAIKRDLLNGSVTEGAYLEYGDHLRIKLC